MRPVRHTFLYKHNAENSLDPKYGTDINNGQCGGKLENYPSSFYSEILVTQLRNPHADFLRVREVC